MYKRVVLFQSLYKMDFFHIESFKVFHKIWRVVFSQNNLFYILTHLVHSAKLSTSLPCNRQYSSHQGIAVNKTDADPAWNVQCGGQSSPGRKGILGAKKRGTQPRLGSLMIFLDAEKAKWDSKGEQKLAR